MSLIDIEIKFEPDWGFEERVEHLLRLVLANQTTLQKEIREVMNDQERLDADVIAIKDGVSNIAAEIADLKAKSQTGQPLDFSGLDEAVASLQGLETVQTANPTSAPSSDAASTPESSTSPASTSPDPGADPGSSDASGSGTTSDSGI